MKNRTTILICIVVACVTLVGVIGFSYSYFGNIVTGIGDDVLLTSDNLTLSFDDETSVSRTNIFPGDTIEKVITVTNNSNKHDVSYNLIWSNLTNTFGSDELVISLDCKIYSNYNSASQVYVGNCAGLDHKPIGTSVDVPLIANSIIKKGFTHEYSIIILFEETNTDQNYNKGSYFNGTLDVTGQGFVNNFALCDDEDNSIGCVINRDNIAVSDSFIDFGLPADGGNGQGYFYTSNLAKTENRETVFYFRGDVTNNYLVFAGYCWKIVRIAEDDSVKLFYYGEYSDGACPQSHESIGTSQWDNASSDAAFSGYMFGNSNTFSDIVAEAKEYTGVSTTYVYTFGSSITWNANTRMYDVGGTLLTGNWNTSTICNNTVCPATNYYTCFDSTSCDKPHKLVSWVTDTSGNFIDTYKASSSYEQAHANLTSSIMKSFLETWYQDNLVTKGTSVTSMIQDTVYCDDRKLHNGLGYGNGITYYEPYSRIQKYFSPTYVCNQANDKFAVSGTIGNGKLSYPIGLLTVDELMYAGIVYPTKTEYTRNNNFLNTKSKSYWLMTTSDYSDNTPFKELVLYYGALSSAGKVGYSQTAYHVIPVISLKSTSTITSGNGTLANPYIVN